MIICLTGLPGSGKTVSAKLFKATGFKVIGMSLEIKQLMKKQKIEINNKNLRNFSNELRKKYGNEIVAKLTVKRAKTILKKEENQKIKLLIEGIRSLQEIRYFKKLFKKIYIIAVISDQKIRYDRISKRARKDDTKSYKDFLWREDKELKWGVADTIKSADILIFNNSTKKDLKNNIYSLIQKLKD